MGEVVTRRWYVVRVQSGRENTVQTALTRRLKIAGKETVVPRVLVPTESITELKAGKKRTRKRKLYPGYVLVEVEEEKGKVPRDVWFLVRETQGVGDFVGRTVSRSPSTRRRSVASSTTSRRARRRPRRSRSRSRRATSSRSRKARSSPSRARSTRSFPPRAWCASS